MEDSLLNRGSQSGKTIRMYVKWETAKCDLLKALDKELALPFRLKDVVDAGDYNY